jgi:cytosine/uracil/thiamine/allantoin permease
VSLVLGVTSAAWVQANFLNIDYGQFTGMAIQWQDFTKTAPVNTAIWVVLIMLPAVVRFAGRGADSGAYWLGPSLPP